MFSKGAWWFNRLADALRTLPGLVCWLDQDIHAQFIHHSHIAPGSELVRHIGIERGLPLGQLFLDLIGAMSIVGTRCLHLRCQFILWQRKNCIQSLHQILTAIEQDAPSMLQAPRYPFILELIPGFVHLSRDIDKWQPVQFAIKEVYPAGVISILPAS